VITAHVRAHLRRVIARWSHTLRDAYAERRTRRFQLRRLERIFG